MLNGGYLAGEALLALPPLAALLAALGSWPAALLGLALAEALGHAAFYRWLAPRPASLPPGGRVAAQLREAGAGPRGGARAAGRAREPPGRDSPPPEARPATGSPGVPRAKRETSLS